MFLIEYALAIKETQKVTAQPVSYTHLGVCQPVVHGGSFLRVLKAAAGKRISGLQDQPVQRFPPGCPGGELLFGGIPRRGQRFKGAGTGSCIQLFFQIGNMGF